MLRAVSIPYQPPAIPWLEPLPLAESIQLGDGLDSCQLTRGLRPAYPEEDWGFQAQQALLPLAQPL